MARMSLETAIRLSAEVKGANNITKVQRSLQDLAQGSKTTARDMQTLRAATFQYARANDGTIAGIRNSITAFRGLQEQAKIGSREFQRYGSEIQKLESKLRGIDGTAEKAGKSMGQNLASGLAAGLAAAGVGQAVRGSIEAVVASEESQRRLRSLSQGLDDYSRVQATATAAAQKFGVAQTQANQEFAQIYARLRPVGLTLEEISTVYNGFNTAAKLSGASSAEASAAFLQLSQALGTGVLRGEELNSVFEQTPAVVQGIAQVMGVPIGQIRDLAKEGKISGDIVLEALRRIEIDGAPKLAEAMKGPAQQFKNLQIAGQDLQIQLGQALLPTALALTNAALALAQGFNNLPGPVKNTAIAVGIAATATAGLVLAIGALKTALAVVGGVKVLTAALVGKTAATWLAVAATKAMSVALLALPWVAAAAGLGLLGKAVYDTNETFRNFVDNIGGVLAADFRNAVNGMAADARIAAGDIEESYENLATEMNPVADFIRQLFKDVFKDTSDSAQASAAQSTGAFNDFFTSLSTSATEGFSGLSAVINNWWSNLPAPIRRIFEGNTVSMLTGAAQYAGGAASRAAAPNAQASGMYGRYAPGGAQVSFAQPAAAPNAMGTPIGATVGGGGTNTIAGIEKSIKALKELQEQAVIGSSDFNRYSAELAQLEARLKSLTGAAKQSAEDRIAAKPFGREIIAAAKANSLDPALFAALVAQESGFNQRAVSRSGAIGLSQLMPGTAKELGVDPRDPMQNLMGGAKYLRQQLDRFGLEGGLRAYNQGPGAQQRTPGGNSRESREYPGRVLARYEQFAGGGEGMAGLEAEGIKAQADAAEKMREQLKAAESINVALKDRLALAQTTGTVERQMLDYDIEQNQLAREYQDLRDAAAGPDELILINANLIIEQRIKQIEHEEKLNSLLSDRAVLMADIATKAAMPTVYNELETQEAALQAVLEKYPAIGAAADAAATLATSGVSEMIAGTKDAKEVFVDFLGSIADALMDTAKRMIAQYIAIGIARIFAGMGNPVATDAGGWATSFATPQSAVGTGFNFDAGAMTGGMPWSFAGGGYTGNAPRAGGVDGQGGFPAILHPQETVIDHTRAMAVPYQRAAAAATTPAMEVPYQRSGPTMAVPFQKAAGGAAVDGIDATIDVKFETVSIGGVDYVTRDEAEQIGRESAQRGADLAHKRFRNSPSARRAAGMS